MTATVPGLRAALLREGLLIDTGLPGIYGTGPRFEAVVTRLEQLIATLGADQNAETMRFPPLMPRARLEETRYLQAFPHLLGTVHAFEGGEAAHQALLESLARGDGAWLAAQQPTQAVLTPACCYPVYPAMAARGALPACGCVVDVQSWCFRHEPSPDPARLQTFRQREFVFMGAAEAAAAFRATWQTRAEDFLRRLGLPHLLQPATDPFFGWHGEIMAALQSAGALKTELLVPIGDDAAWTACISFNLHRDHFSRSAALRLAEGTIAETACVGFGLERLAMALFRHHGVGLDAGLLGD